MLKLSIFGAFTAILLLFIVCTHSENAEKPKQSVSRMINGQAAKKGMFPCAVFLKTTDENKCHRTCGGALIDNEWILTAARCLKK